MCKMKDDIQGYGNTAGSQALSVWIEGIAGIIIIIEDKMKLP